MLNVVFVHPDLGIGGAERAVVDAALALKSRGHEVCVVTAHHDRSHCFEETCDGRLPVIAVGDWLPRSFFGRCRAFCAYIRMIYAALYLVLFSGLKYDLVFCDQISACIPIIRCFSRSSKILFYCHFPDLLLTDRRHWLKRLYRAPLDWLEEYTTGLAHCVLVNSRFTAQVFRETFRSISHIVPEVLYPVPDCFGAHQVADEVSINSLIPTNATTIFLSINRYERKKNVALAIEALALLHDVIAEEDFAEVHLVVAGGYDELVDENVAYYNELRDLASQLDVGGHITFLRNVTSAQKHSLLTHATCLLYTPSREHFGIVPIEAMYAQCPVIAVDSGGPCETIIDNCTGFLRSGIPEEFADAMKQFVGNNGAKLKHQFGEAGRQRVREYFSFESFTSKLERIVCSLCAH
jgi:alpha-1,3/alpha-1,6-mannosyltransferase